MTARKYLRNHMSPKCLHDGCWGLPPNIAEDFGNYKSLPRVLKKLLTFLNLSNTVEVMEGWTAGQVAEGGTQPADSVPLSRQAVYGGML
jgi:hypothetical protein